MISDEELSMIFSSDNWEICYADDWEIYFEFDYIND